eukprot:5242055-Lingulodinium_polyedra.AAC.1
MGWGLWHRVSARRQRPGRGRIAVRSLPGGTARWPSSWPRPPSLVRWGPAPSCALSGRSRTY